MLEEPFLYRRDRIGLLVIETALVFREQITSDRQCSDNATKALCVKNDRVKKKGHILLFKNVTNTINSNRERPDVFGCARYTFVYDCVR